MDKFYPEKINRRFQQPRNSGLADKADARGRWASFICGVSVEFSLVIDAQSKKILTARFKTNGCGYTLAGADLICEKLTAGKLTDLHALEDLAETVENELGEFPPARRHCLDLCLEALHKALAEYRRTRIEEWTGEKALICTCFGISEERIEREIEEKNLTTVEEVGETCQAGTGCGSCQPLIQEILDSG